MRVIGGSVGGATLLAPPTPGTRPTSDLMRGVIFNMLAPVSPFGAVADLYAGSGALGIEALSRGAERAVFVEQNLAACRTIRRNLETTGFAAHGEVVHAALPAALRRLVGPFDLVLLDPPYDAGALLTALHALAGSALLTPEAFVVAEHRGGHAVPAQIGALVVWKRRRQGDSGVTMYRRIPEMTSASG